MLSKNRSRFHSEIVNFGLPRNWHLVHKLQRKDSHSVHSCKLGQIDIRLNPNIQLCGNELKDFHCGLVGRSTLDGRQLLPGKQRSFRKDFQNILDLNMIIGYYEKELPRGQLIEEKGI